jgi:hypothetical protein
MCPRNVPVRTKFVSHFTGLSILKVYFYQRAVSCFCSRSTSVTFFIAHGKRIISGALLNVGKPGAKRRGVVGGHFAWQTRFFGRWIEKLKAVGL